PSRLTTTSLASWLRSSAIRVSSRSWGLSSTRRIGLSMLLSVVACCAVVQVGQGKVEGCALVEPSLGPDATAVAFDDPPHAGQTDAGAFEFLHAVQTLEHPKQLRGVLHVEADAVVANVDHRFPFVTLGTDLDAGRRAVAAVLDGVADQVAQHHVDEGGIGDHPGHRLELPFDVALLVVRTHLLKDRGDHGTEIH